jgi:cation:H+ antiporter
VSLPGLILQFSICSVMIGLAGFTLCRSADALAAAYGWGRGWVGLAFLATVTSLPELVSGVSAVAWVEAPNLAVGDVLGSCVFNLLLLVLVDALQPDPPLFRDASSVHLLSAAFGIVALGFVAMSVLLAWHAPTLFHVGLYSPLMLMLYLLSLASVSRYERMGRPVVDAEAPDGVDVRPHWRRFGIAAFVVLLAGGWLPEVADGLARSTGLSRSFVGTLWLAFATSLPEIAVTLSALRLRALDLAIANLLGSNLFNIAVLAVDDAAYLRGPLLANVAPVHVGTAVAAMIMSGLVIIGLLLRPQSRVLRVSSWISLGLLSIYVVNAMLIFLLGE